MQMEESEKRETDGAPVSDPARLPRRSLTLTLSRPTGEGTAVCSKYMGNKNSQGHGLHFLHALERDLSHERAIDPDQRVFKW